MMKLFSDLCLSLVISFFSFYPFASWANSDVEDIPEEILRTEIIIEARSPMDNKPLSASEYAELQTNNQISPYPPQISSYWQQQILLLRLLKMIRTVNPFSN